MGVKKKKNPLQNFLALLCLQSPRVFVHEAGSAGLNRKGLQGVIVVTIRDRGAAWPKARLPSSLLVL